MAASHIVEAKVDWFGALGQPLVAAERHAIEAYLAALGLTSTQPAMVVQSWEALAPIIRHASLECWNGEHELRRAMTGAGNPLRADGEWVQLNDAIHAAATSAAARFGCSDAGLIKAATGAASFAAHDYQLATAAQCGPQHAFAHKYALFARGRWPLGLYDGRFAIF